MAGSTPTAKSGPIATDTAPAITSSTRSWGSAGGSTAYVPRSARRWRIAISTSVATMAVRAGSAAVRT